MQDIVSEYLSSLVETSPRLETLFESWAGKLAPTADTVAAVVVPDPDELRQTVERAIGGSPPAASDPLGQVLGQDDGSTDPADPADPAGKDTSVMGRTVDEAGRIDLDQSHPFATCGSCASGDGSPAGDDGGSGSGGGKGGPSSGGGDEGGGYSGDDGGSSSAGGGDE